jgi:HAD superfamily hydrolase (TIGR01662 family)
MILLVCGLPASGKTTITKQYPTYERLNRDLVGGKVIDLLPKLESLIDSSKDIIIDNLFTKISDRKPFIDLAKKKNVEIKCIWQATSIEECQVNVCRRLYSKYGKILSPEELKKEKDPNTFPPAVLFKANKEFEKPSKEEGFSEIIKSNFNRTWEAEYSNKALILDYDGTLREIINGNGMFPTNMDQIKLLPKRTEVLKSYVEKGYRLLGASNQSGIAKGDLTREMAVACFEHTNKLIGLNIEYQFDPSKVPPIISWKRKPMPGMGIEFVEKYKLNPRECIMVGDMTSDKTFATRCGFQYADAEEFFK